MTDVTNIAQQHQEYIERLPQWQRCRDFISGADALRKHDINNAGNQFSYLERLSEKQSYGDYLAYIRRALYDNTVRRIRNSLLGLVFAKEPHYELPAKIEYLYNDSDLKETPLTEFCETVVMEILNVGRYGVLVDRPPNIKNEMSKLEAEMLGFRPNLAGYQAEAIINWTMSRRLNKYKLTRVVLLEEDQSYRELLLDEFNRYCVKFYNKEKVQVGDTVYPEMNGKTINTIPFYFFGPQSGSENITESPMLDVVEIARSWYQSSADLEHARFACALPTPYFIGFSEDEAKSIVLGGLNGIVAVDSAAKTGFLEYSGQGVQPLETALSTKYEMMARHGVDMLADRRDAEATETVRIRAGVQTATLADMVKSFNRIMSQALTFISIWDGANEEAKVELNTEFSTGGISPQEISTLMQGVIQNTITQKDFNNRLRKVGLIKEDRDDETINADLQGAKEANTGTL